MDYTHYKTSPLEEWINEMYFTHSIYTPNDLDIHRIAEVFGGEILYLPTRSHAYWDDDDTGEFLISLDSRLDKPVQRSHFFHELCHPLRHVGNQKVLPKTFRDLQETQASLFQQYAAIPFFMVRELEVPLYEKNIVNYWAHVFNVTVSLALRRYNQIKSRIIQAKNDLKLLSYHRSLYQKADPANRCNEAKEMFRVAIQRKKEKEVVYK
ncbi:ImmA/IrrE family metallo-endopeptidase [Brevibacillus sp. Leaf182]|uniref:ImmA/IrrE family metallo-endopeptidase n=1 Tax=Brevibacillus sp. Leaf182 TaxID=1736290 RepID=UPI0006F5209A|nr:ImmA/IrrE family metallo-endopeptidase [Brevibacillus sp. Leaf182]RAT99654.1 ImmA/IrrE family metallo-endopeptidase [Brevibacillus sp. Leaf182]